MILTHCAHAQVCRSIKNVYKVILSHRIRIARAFFVQTEKKNCICSLVLIFCYMGVGLCASYTQRQLLTNARNKCSFKRKKKKNQMHKITTTKMFKIRRHFIISITRYIVVDVRFFVSLKLYQMIGGQSQNR